jgi:predicted nucleic acid-binding protein
MLLDTSGLYALLDASESRHHKARQEFDRAAAPFTHAYVLAELVPLCQVRGVPRATILEFVSGLLTSGEIEVSWADRTLHEAAHQLLLARPDKTYSLCDAASFILMKQRHEMEALTTDHHFEQEGFVRLLPPWAK